MKTWGNLFQRITRLDNLYEAACKARKRKTRKGYVEDFELRRERHLRELKAELDAGEWQPAPYRHFYIHDPKQRLISAAPFRDRVVHHALCNVLEPILQRRFIHDTYSCQKGKGTLAARERCRAYTNRYEYVLKGDIRKFFQSIDQTCLLEKLGRVVRCRPTLALCARIIDSYQDEEVSPCFFADDDLFSVNSRKRGLPIGNLTSQLWANFYLDGLDHFVKEGLRVPGYARYTDDFLVWSDDRDFLKEVQSRIATFLQGDRLLLQARKTRVFPVRVGVPFLGFRFYPGQAPRILASSKRRFEKRCRRQAQAMARGKLSREAANLSAEGWLAFARYGQSEGLLQSYYRHGFGQTG